SERLFINSMVFEYVAAVGFLAMILSNFLSFTPIEERTWREIGVGLPVVMASIVGIAMVFKKQYFSSFFIAMFSAFFITHEIIICYDNRAVELGREIGADGWFRLLPIIFTDALKPGYGAFWGTFGISVAIVAILVAWMIATYKANLDAVENEVEEVLSEEFASAEYFDESEQTQEFPSTDGSEEDQEEII
ncbi:MAG: hypothetical protein AB1403_26320, partial [Candidatus Riflebacteria bacterium]